MSAREDDKADAPEEFTSLQVSFSSSPLSLSLSLSLRSLKFEDINILQYLIN